MEITETDKIVLKALMKDAASEVVQPLHNKLDSLEKMVNNHHQTIYGPEGNAGVYNGLKKLNDRVVILESTKKQVIAWAAGVSGTISAGVAILKSFIK